MKTIFEELRDVRICHAICVADNDFANGDQDWFIIISLTDFKKNPKTFRGMGFKVEHFFKHNVAEKSMTKKEVLIFKAMRDSGYYRCAKRDDSGAVYEISGWSFESVYNFSKKKVA